MCEINKICSVNINEKAPAETASQTQEPFNKS